MSQSTVHRYPIIILEKHLDTFGHVNNAVYLQIYEEARWELITSNGYGLNKVQELMIGPVILQADVKFLKELHLREPVTVTTETIEYNGKIGKVRQRMLKADDAIASEAIFTMALFDLKARKMIAPTPEWKHAIGLDQ